MAKIPPLEYEQASPGARAIWDAEIEQHGRMTNMKRTLAHSPVALKALLEWYALHVEVKAFLGERAAMLFAHAISNESDCLICSTFFRRILTEMGEDPDQLLLGALEELLVEYGRLLAHTRRQIPEAVLDSLLRHLEPAQLVALTAFGGLMVATNLFNNALGVDLDQYLEPFQRRER